MADLKIKIGAVTDGLKRGLANAENSMRKFGSKISRIGGTLKSMAGLGVGLLAGMAVKSNILAARFEQAEVAFSVMLGSMDKAKQIMQDLTEFSTKTPFTPEEVIKAAKTLLAFGISQDKVMASLKSLGDVSAATGKDLSELARIYGKVFVKGKMQAEELNQLSEAGVPIIKELQKMYGKTGEEIFKMGETGKLKFKDLNGALSNMTTEGGVFFDMMAKQSETAAGKFSTLKGNIDEAFRALSNLKFSKTLLDQANELAKMVAEIGSAANKTPAKVGAFDFFEAGFEDILGINGHGEAKARLAVKHRVTAEDIKNARIQMNAGANNVGGNRMGAELAKSNMLLSKIVENTRNFNDMGGSFTSGSRVSKLQSNVLWTGGK